MNNRTGAPRLHGLDTLRALAIILVLVYHYRVVVSNDLLFGFISNIGWVGVDLFFVLSGYLIGDQILRAFSEREPFSFKNFYVRRLLRTLPNYYVVLALYLLFPTHLSGTYTAPFWQFVTFTQNLDMRPGETFTHSWSLCVEEQFYLLFPLVCLLTLRQTTEATRLWAVIVLGMLGAIIARTFMFNAHAGKDISAFDYYEYIYYPSYSRFDELLPGVAIALLKNYHKSTFDKLLRYGNHFLIAGIVCSGVVFYLFLNIAYRKETGTSLWVPCIGYSLLAVSFSFLVIAALSPRCWLHHRQVAGAKSLALWSYAIYLIHKPLYQLLKEPVKNVGISTDGYLGMGVIVITSAVCGWLLFKLVETPFMNLRTQLVPSNMRSFPELRQSDRP